MNSIPNKELNQAFQYLTSMTGMGLSLPELKKLRLLRKIVRERMIEYDELRKAIWDSYEIADDAALAVHPEKEEILKKVEELDNETVAIDEFSFLEEEKVLAGCPPQFNQVDIDYMVKYLSKS